MTAMTGDQFEKAYALTHYRDAAGQAQEDRRKNPRRRKDDTALDTALALVRREGYTVFPPADDGGGA